MSNKTQNGDPSMAAAATGVCGEACRRKATK